MVFTVIDRVREDILAARPCRRKRHSRKQTHHDRQCQDTRSCHHAAPVNVVLRKTLLPDMAHQPRTAVLPLGSWGALSTSGNRRSGLHSLLDFIDGILVQVRERAVCALVATLRLKVVGTPEELVIGLAFLFPLSLVLTFAFGLPSASR